MSGSSIRLLKYKLVPIVDKILHYCIIKLKFKGLYKAKELLNNDRYLITDIEGFQITQIPFKSVFESQNIKPWIRL